MKKLLTCSTALIMCVLMCFSLAACGEKSSDGEKDVTTSPNVSSEPAQKNDQDQDGDQETLESYFADHKDELDMLIAELEGDDDTLSVNISAEGNLLILDFMYTEDMEDDELEMVKEGLESYISSMDSDFEDLLSTVQEEVPSTEGVVVSFLTNKGDEIYSKGYNGAPKNSEDDFGAGLNTGDYATLEEFVADNQELLDEMMDGISNDSLTVSVSANGNTLIYDLKYLVDVGDVSVAKETLETMMDSMDSYYDMILTSMRAGMPDTEALVVNFLDMNGTLIYSKEYR